MNVQRRTSSSGYRLWNACLLVFRRTSPPLVSRRRTESFSLAQEVLNDSRSKITLRYKVAYCCSCSILRYMAWIFQCDLSLSRQTTKLIPASNLGRKNALLLYDWRESVIGVDDIRSLAHASRAELGLSIGSRSSLQSCHSIYGPLPVIISQSLVHSSTSGKHVTDSNPALDLIHSR